MKANPELVFLNSCYWGLDNSLPIDSLPAMAVAYQPESGPPRSESVTDELILRTLEGDALALDTLVKNSHKYLCKMIGNHLIFKIRRDANVEDVSLASIGRVFKDELKMLRGQKYKTARCYKAYLLRAAINEITDYRRGPEKKDLLTSSLDANLEPGDESSPTPHDFCADRKAKSPRDLMILKEIGEQIIQAMAWADLSEEKIMILHMWSEGYPMSEIAQLLGQTENAIYIAKHRALKDLRPYFESQLSELLPSS